MLQLEGRWQGTLVALFATFVVVAPLACSGSTHKPKPFPVGDEGPDVDAAVVGGSKGGNKDASSSSPKDSAVGDDVATGASDGPASGKDGAKAEGDGGAKEGGSPKEGGSTADASSSDTAPVSGDGSSAMNKISNLVVHDTVADNKMWSVRSGFEIGMNAAHPFYDRAPVYIVSIDDAAKGLLGKTWIQTAASSKGFKGGAQATITLSAAADVYIFVDDRWADKSWAMGWTDTGAKIHVWESVTVNSLGFGIYVKRAQIGDVDLPGIGSNAAYNYFVVVD